MKKWGIFCILIAMYCFSLFGSSKIDSLEIAIKAAKEKEKPELLNKLAVLYMDVDLEMSLECALQAKELAKKFKQSEEESKALYNLGVYSRKKRDYPTALSYFQKSLKIRKNLGNLEEIAMAHKAIGNVYNYQGNFSKALDSYYEALKILLSTNDDFLISAIYNNIGICYNRLGDYNHALENYYKSLNLKEKMLNLGELDKNDIRIYSTLNNIGNLHLRLREFEKALEIFLRGLECCDDDISTSKLLNNIGIAYQEMGDLEKALFYYERALSMNMKLDMKDKISASLNNIGYIYDMLKDWQKSLGYYQKSLEMKQEIGDQFGTANCQKNIGSVYIELKQYKTAEQYLQQSNDLAKKIGAQEIIKDCYKFLSRLYKEQNDFKLSLDYELKYSDIKDSLFHESMAEQLAAIESNYEIVKSEKENEKLLKDNLLYKVNIQKANLDKLRFVILALLLLILTLIITFAYFQKRAIARILQKSKSELEIMVDNRTNELAATNDALRKEIEERTKADAIIKESLKEKEVMLREIHHRVKNNLQIISSILNLQSYSEIDDKSLAMLENTRNRIYSMSLIHEKLYMENNLAQIDFKDYISGLLNYLLGNYPPDSKKIALKFDLKQIFVNLDTAIPCGLLINEIFTNSVKHAFQNMNEGQITVQMFKDEDNYFHLKIGDNGNLIHSEDELSKIDSIGMKLIRLLAKQINSEMIIDLDNGVNYTFKFKEK